MINWGKSISKKRLNLLTSEYSKVDFSGILLGNLARLLQDEVQGATVHVLHTDVDLSITETIQIIRIMLTINLDGV